MRATEFAEIRRVLKQDGLLFVPGDDAEVYAEFAATYLELGYFDPDLLSITFPILKERKDIGSLLAVDVDAEALLEATRPQPGLPPLASADEAELPAHVPVSGDPGSSSDVKMVRKRAEQFRKIGNFVRAALTRGSKLGPRKPRPISRNWSPSSASRWD